MKMSRSAVLPAYNDNLLRAMLSVKLEERVLPDLKEGEVLVKMEGAPCNPSDIAFLRGGYNIIKVLPVVPGFEGTGMVVEAGNGAEIMMGKRVSCFVQETHDGTWAEYFIAGSTDCIVLKDGISTEQAACLSINPLTAWALMEMAVEDRCKAFVQNAAGGQVPRIMTQLAKKYGLKVINLVRRESGVEELNNHGMEHVLNTEDEGFNEHFKQLCDDLKPSIAFDAVGGGLSGIILNVLPPGSSLVVYGALSGEALTGIDPMGIIFHRKAIKGFNLNDWMASKTKEEFDEITDSIQNMVISGEIETLVQGRFKLEDLVAGMRAYIKSMSSGKIIFIP